MKHFIRISTVCLGFVLLSFTCHPRYREYPETLQIEVINYDTISLEDKQIDSCNLRILLLQDSRLVADPDYYMTEMMKTGTNRNNAIFELQESADSIEWVTIYRDSIFTSAGVIEFTDYNNDNTDDILIQNTSSARSCWTYYLYLVEKNPLEIRKIRNFETIPNPFLDKENNIISNYALSGTNWSSFYEIRGDSIFDFNITIEDIRAKNDPDNSNHYDSEYRKAIRKIKQEKRNSK